MIKRMLHPTFVSTVVFASKTRNMISRILKPLPLCLSQKQRDHLWSKVDKERAHRCWPWKGSHSKSGYPRIWISNIDYVATRIAYLDFYGKQPGKLLVCHSCDNPSCMNPRHFFLGTNEDNNKDRHTKGRDCRGSQHHLAKLTKTDVIEILKLEGKSTAGKIAQRFGVSTSTIKAIFIGTNWSWLTGRTKT